MPNLEVEEGEAQRPPRPAARGPNAWAHLTTWVRERLGLPHPAGELFARADEQAQLYQQLLRRVLLDRPTADRLLAFERQRAPHANRAL